MKRNSILCIATAALIAVSAMAFAESAPKETPSNPSELAETAAGDLVADSMRAGTGADAALVNAGSIGFEDLPENIDGDTIGAVIPFESDSVVVIQLRGSDLLSALERSVSILPRRFSGFLQLSGVTIKVDPRNEKGGRILDAQINGDAIEPAATYAVAVTEFLADGGSGFLMLKKGKIISEQPVSLQSVVLKHQSAVDPEDVGSRIKIVASKKNGK